MVEQVLMSITHFSVHVKVLGCYEEVLKLAHRYSQGYEFQQEDCADIQCQAKPKFPWGILSWQNNSDGRVILAKI